MNKISKSVVETFNRNLCWKVHYDLARVYDTPHPSRWQRFYYNLTQAIYVVAFVRAMGMSLCLWKGWHEEFSKFDVLVRFLNQNNSVDPMWCVCFALFIIFFIYANYFFCVKSRIVHDLTPILGREMYVTAIRDVYTSNRDMFARINFVRMFNSPRAWSVSLVNLIYYFWFQENAPPEYRVRLYAPIVFVSNKREHRTRLFLMDMAFQVLYWLYMLVGIGTPTTICFKNTTIFFSKQLFGLHPVTYSTKAFERNVCGGSGYSSQCTGSMFG